MDSSSRPSRAATALSLLAIPLGYAAAGSAVNGALNHFRQQFDEALNGRPLPFLTDFFVRHEIPGVVTLAVGLVLAGLLWRVERGRQRAFLPLGLTAAWLACLFYAVVAFVAVALPLDLRYTLIR